MFLYYMFFIICILHNSYFFFFFFNDTATTEIYTLSLHDALPICPKQSGGHFKFDSKACDVCLPQINSVNQIYRSGDRKSTRLNSSHLVISYAVFCLKKKKNKYEIYVHVKNSLSCICDTDVHNG